jgi:hypothetical protein
MRELNLNEIHNISGGDWSYPWWSIPLFAAGAAGLSNGWVMYKKENDLSRGVATFFHFGIPAAITSVLIMGSFEAVYALGSFAFSLLPSPQGNGASCHG